MGRLMLVHAIILWFKKIMATASSRQQLETLQVEDVRESQTSLFFHRQYNLGMTLRQRFEVSRQRKDIDAAIETFSTLSKLLSQGSWEWTMCIVGLSEAFRVRFEALGQTTDLHNALRACQVVLDANDVNSPSWSKIQVATGNALLTRYEALGQINDLDNAIDFYYQALERTPQSSLDWNRCQNNLSNSLRTRFSILQQPADLDASISAAQQALNANLSHSLEYAQWQNNLGNALIDRYVLNAQIDDLNTAIETFTSSLNRVREHGAYIVQVLSNLVGALLHRFAALEKDTDLDQAIEFANQAVSTALANSLDRSIMQKHLGIALRRRFEFRKQRTDLDEAIIALKKARAFLDPDVWPQYALSVARELGDLYFSQSVWSEAAQILAQGVKIINDLYHVQLLSTDREAWLTHSSELFHHAAYALAKDGQLGSAVVTLEGCRARRIRESLTRDRADLARVKDEDPQAYEEYLSAITRLHQLEVAARKEMTLPSLRLQIHETRHDLTALIERIRKIDGLQNFLIDDEGSNVRVPIRENTILIYLVITTAGGLALLTHINGITAVWLNFTTSDLNSLLIERDIGNIENIRGGYLGGQLFDADWLKRALDQGLPQLGEQIVAPIAKQLRAMHVERVVIIPVGRIGLLPLHAARYTLNDREISFLDEFTVTYSSSANILAKTQRSAWQQSEKIHLVGVANPLPTLETLEPLHNQLRSVVRTLPSNAQIDTIRYDLERLLDLPVAQLIHYGSALRVLAGQLAVEVGEPVRELLRLIQQWPLSLHYAKDELSSVIALLSEENAQPLYEQIATKEMLTRYMPDATIVYFACHGSFQFDPLESAVLLANGQRLTLRELLAPDFQGLKRTQLVVLSACQTAITDFYKAPDEVIGLPVGFIQAGAPAVIATLWNVNDISTALLMIHCCELIFIDHYFPEIALREAQRWLRDLTNVELDIYLQERSFRIAMHSSRNHIASNLVLALRYQRRSHDPRIKARFGEPHARPFADPYFWAPFTFHGTSEVIL